MGENLKDWQDEACVRQQRQQRYRSKHDPNAQLVKSGFNPKYVGDGYKYGQRIKVKTAVPRRSDAPPLLSETKKNFVVANAIETILKSKFLPRC